MWKTLNGIGRQKVLFANKNNDFTIDLGSDWGTVEFFITIKKIKYPQVLKSISYNITKLSNRRYKISPVIQGADYTGWREYTGTQFYSAGGTEGKIPLQCYGFQYSWACSISRTYSNIWGVPEIWLNKQTITNLYYDAVHNYEGFESPWGQRWAVTSGSGYLNLGTENNYDIVLIPENGTHQSGDVSWKFRVNPIQSGTFKDSESVELSVLAIEVKPLNKTTSTSYPWSTVSTLYFKSSSVQLPKAVIQDIYLPNYSKGTVWRNSQIIGGAVSLYNPQGIIGEYILDISKMSDMQYRITNSAKTYNTFSVYTTETDFNGFKLSGVSNVTLMLRYFWEYDTALANSCDLKLYNNGVLIGNIKGLPQYNYPGDTMLKYYVGMVQYNYKGGIYFSVYYSIPIPEETLLNKGLNLSLGGTFPPSFKNGVGLKVTKSSYYLLESNSTTTYNETLVYMCEKVKE